jgi:hypothetical protein
MSGGSMEYLYLKVQDTAEDLQQSKCKLRRAFGNHLVKVAKALHDIEWIDSGDGGDERASIEIVLGTSSTPLELAEAIKDANELLNDLHELITKATK